MGRVGSWCSPSAVKKQNQAVNVCGHLNVVRDFEGLEVAVRDVLSLCLNLLECPYEQTAINYAIVYFFFSVCSFIFWEQKPTQCFTWILVISGFGQMPRFCRSTLLIMLEELIVFSCTNAILVHGPLPVVEFSFPPQPNNMHSVIHDCEAQACGAVQQSVFHMKVVFMCHYSVTKLNQISAVSVSDTFVTGGCSGVFLPGFMFLSFSREEFRLVRKVLCGRKAVDLGFFLLSLIIFRAFCILTCNENTSVLSQEELGQPYCCGWSQAIRRWGAITCIILNALIMSGRH